MDMTFALVENYIIQITNDDATMYRGLIYAKEMSEATFIPGKYEELRFIDEESALRYFIYLVRYETKSNF
jgi:hypothetical protein